MNIICQCSFKKLALQSNQNSHEVIESVSISSDLTKNLNEINESDPKVCNIQKLDSMNLENIFNSSKYEFFLLHFWSIVNEETVTDLSKIYSLTKNATNIDCLIICCDFSTKKQIDLIRRYLYSRKLYIDSYVIENKAVNMQEFLQNAKGMNEYRDILMYIDNNYKLLIPQTYIINKEKKILFHSQKNVDLEEIKEIIKKGLNHEKISV